MARHLRRIPVLPAIMCFLLALFMLVACPKPENGKECPPCEEGEVCDVETGQCVPQEVENGNGEEELPCGSDFDDCEVGEVCDLSTGECVPGVACDPDLGAAYATNAHCNWNTETNASDPGWGCGGSRADDCICDPIDNICKRRRQTCEPCGDDEECGPHSHFADPAECVPFDGGQACLVVASARGCPAGYLPDGEHCAPTEGSCEDIFACTSDADCPEDRPICHRTTGTCRAGCTYDFTTGDSVGCPPNQVCHGDGRCRAPCTGDDTCREIDSDYVCFEEPFGLSRCRIEGCLHDVECPVPQEGPYLGFCDLAVNICHDDRCYRNDVDGALHENPDRHCRDGFACRASGVCEQMACTERIAPSIACGYHQFCCGFCRNMNDSPDRDECDPTPCPPSFETPDGAVEGCFLAEKSKWCQSCGDHPECAGISNPKGDPRDENLCFQERCLLTCENPFDCPVRWQCNPLLVGCETHDDCGAGQCVRLDEDDPDAPMFCVCESGGSGSDALCPDDTRCVRSSSEWLCGFGMFCLEQSSEEEGSYCE